MLFYSLSLKHEYLKLSGNRDKISSQMRKENANCSGRKNIFLLIISTI